MGLTPTTIGDPLPPSSHGATTHCHVPVRKRFSALIPQGITEQPYANVLYRVVLAVPAIRMHDHCIC